jgi:hypothetical protein
MYFNKTKKNSQHIQTHTHTHTHTHTYTHTHTHTESLLYPHSKCPKLGSSPPCQPLWGSEGAEIEDPRVWRSGEGLLQIKKERRKLYSLKGQLAYFTSSSTWQPFIEIHI